MYRLVLDITVSDLNRWISSNNSEFLIQEKMEEMGFSDVVVGHMYISAVGSTGKKYTWTTTKSLRNMMGMLNCSRVKDYFFEGELVPLNTTLLESNVFTDWLSNLR